MFITLEEWVKRHFSELARPSMSQLRAMAKAKRFDPPAQKPGKSWVVDEDAQIIERPVIYKGNDPVISAIFKCYKGF